MRAAIRGSFLCVMCAASLCAAAGPASRPASRPATTRSAAADSSQAQPALPGPVLRGLGGRLAIRVEANSWEALVRKVAPTFTWRGHDMMWIGKGQKGEPLFTMDRAYVYQPAGKAPRWVLLDYKSAPHDKWAAQIMGECIRRTAKLCASKPRSDHGSGNYAVAKDVTAKAGTVYEVGWEALMGGGVGHVEAERRLYIWHDANGKWHFVGEGPKESSGKMGHARNYTYRTESRVTWTGPPVKPVIEFTVTCTYREWSTSDDPPDFVPRRDRIQYSQCVLDGRFPGRLQRITRHPYMLPAKGETFDTLVQHLASWTIGWGIHGEKRQADILAFWREALTRLNPKLPRGAIPKGTRIRVLTNAQAFNALRKPRSAPKGTGAQPATRAGKVLTQPEAAGPRLVNEMRLFPKGDERSKAAGKPGLWEMRLSPDGKHVLYPRAKGEAAPGAETRPDRREVKYELVLRNLTTGKDTVMPIEPLEAPWRTVFTRFNMFDPAGKRLALADVKVERQKVDEHSTAVQPSMNIVLYDIATGKITPTPHKGRVAIAKFDWTGMGLIVMKDWKIHTAALGELKLKALNIQGMLQSVCPAADVICIWLPRRFHAEPGRRGGLIFGEVRPQRLVVYDVKADRQIAVLLLRKEAPKLDDLEPQWTAGGRYLYYYDVEKGEADARGRPRIRPIARIWDRVAKMPAGKLKGVIPVGPGPTATTMVLAGAGTAGVGFILHDAAGRRQWPLGDDTMQLIHACGGRALYAKSSAEGRQAVYVAEITMSGGPASRPTTRNPSAASAEEIGNER